MAPPHPVAAPVTGPSTSLLDTLLGGGPLMWPIGLASVVMGVCVLERLVALRRRRVVPKRFVHCLLSQVEERSLDRGGALELCEDNGSPMARVFAAGLRRWGRSAVEVEQAILDEGERVAGELRQRLRLVSGVANIAPLLGLMGTVWGMREAFDAIASESAMGRPELLAGVPRTLEELTADLVAVASAGEGPSVLIHGDARCDFQHVAAALAACRAARVADVGVSVEADQSIRR